MHVLSFVNQKGGCGKTTTAVHLAGALAARGERTLLIDLDPQAHATLALGQAVGQEASAVDVLRDRVTLSEALRAAPGGFDLLASTPALAEFEELAARLVGPESVLARALERSAWDYDFVLIDCPPRTDGVLAANALRAAHTAVLVIECGTFALQGALQAVQVLEQVAETMDEPFALRAVCTLFDKRSKLARELLVGMHAQFGPLLFDTPVRTSARLRESAAAGLPVQLVDRASRAAQDFEALAEEVVLWARAGAAWDAAEAERDAQRRAKRAREERAELDPLLVSRASAVLHPRPRDVARVWSAHREPSNPRTSP